MAIAPTQTSLTAHMLTELRCDDSSAIPTVMAGLGHTNWQLRRAAVASVARWYRQHSLEGERLPALTAALVDGLNAHDNAGLRNACAQALGVLGDSALPALQHTLGNADVDQRKFIIEALGASGAPRIRQLLVDLLEQELGKLDSGGSDSNIRTALMEALSRYPSPEMRTLLLDLAQAPHATLQDRAGALHTLGAWQAHVPLKPLLALLEMPGLSRMLYPLIGLTHDAQAIACLMQASVTASGATRREAMAALAGLWQALGPQGDAAMEACLASYDDAADVWAHQLDQEPRIVDAAVRLLGLCDCRRFVGDILQACADKGQAQAAIDCLVRQKPQVSAQVLQALVARDTQTQLLCIDVIEAIADPAAAFALVDLLPGASVHLMSAIVRALGSLGGEDVIEILMELVRTNEGGELGRQVVWALSRLAQRFDKAVAEHMRQALACGDVQGTWLRVLGALGHKEDVPRLIAGLGHQDVEVRIGVLEAATHMGAQLPEAAVLASLNDAHPEVRLAAAKLLGAYASDAAFAGLMAAMHDVDPWVVAEAARALGHLHKIGGVQALQQAASHGNGPIAVAALEALARLAPDDLTKTVQLALKHVDAEVVREALRLASQLDRSFAQQTLCEALGHTAWDVRAAAADLLLRKRWLPNVELIDRALERETEPLVRDRLEQLHARLGAVS